jgi:hypothetical protein
MTCDEFLSAMQSRGARFAPPVEPGRIAITNTQLQNMRAAMLPMFIMELYGKTGGIIMGTGYIFGPDEIPNGIRTPVPSIYDVNFEISNLAAAHGKTIFGRNDLFWFGFDSFGTCYMLDNLTLKPLRKYDDPYRALTDCLIAGKL